MTGYSVNFKKKLDILGATGNDERVAARGAGGVLF